MVVLLLASALSMGVEGVADSARVTLRPHEPGVLVIEWSALRADGTVLNRGRSPSEVRQVSDGSPVIYCAENTTVWLALTVETDRYRINASATCTQVTVRGSSIRTEGVNDPRVR